MSDLAALDAITEAVESGRGPAGGRARGRAGARREPRGDSTGRRDARGGGALAGGGASLLSQGEGVRASRCAWRTRDVGHAAHARARPSRARRCAARLTMIASEVERVRAPERASETAAAASSRAARPRADRPRRAARAAREVGLRDLERGGSHARRARPPAGAHRGGLARPRARDRRARRARAVPSARSRCSPSASCVPGAEVIVLLAGRRRGRPRAAPPRASCASSRPGMGGFVFVDRPQPRRRGPARAAARRQRGAARRERRARATSEHRVLAFEETGAYRLLLSAMSENPAELQRFYAETVEPLVAYDEQYETDLVARRGVPRGRRQRRRHRPAPVHPPPHDPLPPRARARALGLDVSSSDGREKLSLGLKSMRVLGITSAGGPASEAGAEGGRVPRRSGSRRSCGSASGPAHGELHRVGRAGDSGWNRARTAGVTPTPTSRYSLVTMFSRCAGEAIQAATMPGRGRVFRRCPSRCSADRELVACVG